MKLKQLVEGCERIALEEDVIASDILSSLLFEGLYDYNSFSQEELQAIIQALSACYGFNNKDLIEQLKKYHSELFKD